MGYFPNGCSGDDYQEQYCFKCINYRDLNDGRGHGCPIWDMHMLYNYDECNKPKSLLHFVIGRDKEGYNEECKMFYEKI